MFTFSVRLRTVVAVEIIKAARKSGEGVQHRTKKLVLVSSVEPQVKSELS